MNELEILHLYMLRNNEHFQFMTFVDNLIVKYGAGELGIDDVYNGFKTLLTSEDNALRIELGSIKSKALEGADKLRDNTWRALDLRIDAALLIPIEDEQASAAVLRRVFNLYGDPRRLIYVEETSVISNLVADLLLPANSPHVEKLGLTTWVAKLKSLNEEFQTLFSQRNEEFAGRDSGNVHDIRIQVDPAYEKILAKINAQVELGLAKPVVANFIAELNEQIKYYKTTLAGREGRSKGNDTTQK